MSRWGARHEAADKDVRDKTTAVKKAEGRGQAAPDKYYRDRGEAITTRADIKEARKSDPKKNG